jgi:hypothetical protein
MQRAIASDSTHQASHPNVTTEAGSNSRDAATERRVCRLACGRLIGVAEIVSPLDEGDGENGAWRDRQRR